MDCPGIHLYYSLSLFLDDLSHEASGSFGDAATSPSSTHLFGGFHMTDRNPASVVQSDPTGSSKGSREQPEFSSKKQKPPELLSKVVAHDNETHQWPSNVSLERVEPFTLPSSVLVSNHSSNSGLFPAWLSFFTHYFYILQLIVFIQTRQSWVNYSLNLIVHYRNVDLKLINNICKL